MENLLISRLLDKRANIGVIGLGYVGLPLALRFSNAGFPVVGLDIDEGKVSSLQSGISDIEHIPSSEIALALADGLEVTTDVSRVAELDALIFCLPTPLTKNREPDLSFIVDTLESIIPFLRSGQVISLESTTYPGTTEDEIVPRISASGLIPGENIFVVYSPEREDPGSKAFSIADIPKVVSGYSPSCLAVGQSLYQSIVNRTVSVSSTKVAEMTKLLENIHRAVNIGLVNELKIVADQMGIDIFEVVDAAATKPFGFAPYRPGPGLGGHCIPIDPFYLTWKAREFGVNTRFIELAGEINQSMPDYVVSKIIKALNLLGKSLFGSKILVLGISYKKDVDDMRESPAVKIMSLLAGYGSKVDYSDPHVPIFPKMRDYQFDLYSIRLSPETLASYDIVLVTTDHSAVDYEMIRDNAQLIVDTRGVFSPVPDKIVRA